MGEKKECLCLQCGLRFACDYALSVWAARARFARPHLYEDKHGQVLMDIEVSRVSSITTECSKFEEQ